jgi:ATP-dependent DNA helicase RecG
VTPPPRATPAAAAPPAGPERAPLCGDDPVGAVPGVRSGHAKAFLRLGVATVADLLRLAPPRFEDRRVPGPAAAFRDGATVTWVGEIRSARLVRARRGLVIVTAVGEDDTGEVRARWFNQPWLARALAGGGRFLLHGPVRAAGRRLELASPAVERMPEGDAPHPGVRRLVPVHPLSTGLSAAACRGAVWAALAAAPRVDDPLPPRLLLGANLPRLADAVRALHFPDAPRTRRPPDAGSPTTSCSSTRRSSRGGAARASAPRGSR